MAVIASLAMTSGAEMASSTRIFGAARGVRSHLEADCSGTYHQQGGMIAGLSYTT